MESSTQYLISLMKNMSGGPGHSPQLCSNDLCEFAKGVSSEATANEAIAERRPDTGVPYPSASREGQVFPRCKHLAQPGKLIAPDRYPVPKSQSLKVKERNDAAQVFVLFDERDKLGQRTKQTEERTLIVGDHMFTKFVLARWVRHANQDCRFAKIDM